MKREALLLMTAVARINVARAGLENSFYTAWVKSGSPAGVTGMSASGGKAEVDFGPLEVRL